MDNRKTSKRLFLFFLLSVLTIAGCIILVLLTKEKDSNKALTGFKSEQAYFFPDGKRILLLFEDESDDLSLHPHSYSCIFNTTSGVLDTIGYNSWVIAPSISHDGNRVAFFSEFGKRVDVYDIKENRWLCNLDISIFPFPNSFIFSPTNDEIVLYKDDAIVLFDMETGNEVRRLEGSKIDENFVYHCCYGPDGTQIVASLGDRLSIWNSETGIIIRSYKVEKALCPSFSPDGKSIMYTVATNGIETDNYVTNSIVVMDAATGIELNRIDLKDCGLGVASYSPNGKWICLSDITNHIITIFNAQSGDCINSFTDVSSSEYLYNSSSFSPDDKLIIITSSDNEVFIKHI